MVWQIISLYADVNIFQSPYEHYGVIYSCHIKSPTNHDYSPAGLKSGRTGETCHCLDCGVAWGVAWGVANRITPLRQQSTSYLRKRALQATLTILPDIERPSDPILILLYTLSRPAGVMHVFDTVASIFTVVTAPLLLTCVVAVKLVSLVPLLVKWNTHESIPGPRASERDELLLVGKCGMCLTIQGADSADV
jgi:hypothetical protein